MPETATFYHYGISPWEIEVIYDTLNRSFEVEEMQLSPDDPQCVSFIEIRFPVPYNETFFQQEFTMDSWFKIKGVIKDVKKRRGRKNIKAFIRFAGFGNNNNNKKIGIVFPLQSGGDRQFEMGIEKIEYLVDIVPVQLQLIPPGAEEIWYLYDEASSKWSPSVAKTSSINYLFKNNEWKTK
ncbi:MAG TPA: hypothetical protein VFZ55_05655 [Nitrososphaera sp.]